MARGDQVAKARRKKPSPVNRVYNVDHRAWRLLKAKHKHYSKVHNAPCWLHEYGLCLYHGAPIDYAGPPQAPMSYECDHRKPRSTHPHLMMVWANCAASHSRCNRARQSKPVGVEQVPGLWIKPSF
jgi:5-methylcytosine-specific restriction endonuclease McrA